MKKYLLGCDIGTSAAKAVLFDLRGNIVASCGREYPLYQPENGWAEQEPDDWWQGAAQSIRGAIAAAGIDPAAIAGVGLTGQMHGLVMLDGAGNVLRRSILWCDQRTQKQCDRITETVGAQKLIEITSNPALTGFTASKIFWVRENEPALYEKCRHILLPKDYVRYRLTGTFATDVSDASGMQLLDVKNRCWSAELLCLLQIDEELLCKVYESASVTGCVSAAAAAATGLLAGTPVVGGAGDQAAAGIGNGIVRQGMVSCNIGSSGVVFAHTDTPLMEKQGRIHTFCSAVRGTWHIMGVTQGAGLSMKWFKDNFYAAESKACAGDVYDLINEQMAAVGAGSDGLLYLPYLMGERTPHLNADARGVFFGLSARHTRAHLARAVMEGVSYSLLDCLNLVRSLGVQPSNVRLCGGGAKSPLWRQVLADMFGVPAAVSASPEAGALGAAALAGVGAGLFACERTAADAMTGEQGRLSPSAQSGAVYARYYPLYKKLYTSLREDFSQLAALQEKRTENK